MTNVIKANKQATVSNMSKALTIFQTLSSSVDPDQSLRQRCIESFTANLGQKPVTAATYFNLCVQKAEHTQNEADDKVRASNNIRKFSAVKTTNASSDVAKKVHLFLTKKAAQEYATLHNYGGVVKGVVEAGQTVQF